MRFPAFANRLLTFGALAACLSAKASEYHETSDFADAVARVEQYADEFGPSNVLLVIDIDNTLLAMSHPLGSDQWFEWQEYLLEHDPDSPQLVGRDFGALLEAQGLLFTLGKMRPPQTNLPELITRVQHRGVPTMVLTSRGEQYRPATERELKACGYDFQKSAMATKAPIEGPFLPYDVANPTAAGLTADDVRLYALKEAKTCTYEHGLFMTQGQHKGAMLLSLLSRAAHPPKAVVFVDDHGRHIHRVYDACVRHGIEASVFHYHKEDENVAHFRFGDKTEVSQRWRRLESALQEVFELPEAAVPASK